MIYRGVLGFAVVLLLSAVAAHGDELYLKDGTKLTGTMLSETAKEVVITGAKKSQKHVPAGDIEYIYYDNVKPITLFGKEGAYQLAKTKDLEGIRSSDPAARKMAFKTAIDNYRETLKKMTKHPYATRNVEYRIAVLTLELANLGTGSMDKALAQMQQYKTNHLNSWQTNHIISKIAQLQVDAKLYKEAEQTYQEMATLAGLPEEVRRDAEMKIVDIYVRAGDIAGATKRLRTLAGKASDAQFASRVKLAEADIYLKQKDKKEFDKAEPLLRQILKDTKDRNVKAQAHNALGESLFATQKYDEALWEFLWVDAVYNQNRDQRAKALYFLGETFTKLNNAERAQECREMLINDAVFAGTEYQRKATGKK